MSRAEYIKAVKSYEINEDRVKDIERIYKTNLEPIVKKIISYADQADFFDEERRALSYREILDPMKYIEFDFVKLGLIPFVDVYDNSYAVFNIASKEWGHYNIIDSVLYKKRKTMEEVI